MANTTLGRTMHIGQITFLLFLASALACIAGWSAFHPALWWGLFVFAGLNTLIGCVDASANERGRRAPDYE